MTVAVAPSMTIQYLDKFEFVQQSKKIKDPETLAASQAKQIETAIETAVEYIKTTSKENSEKLANKNDLILFKTDLTKDISHLKHNVNQVKNDVNQLKHEVHQVKNDVSQLKHEVHQVKNDVNQLKHEVHQVKNDVNQLKHEVHQVKNDVNQLKHDVHQVKNEVHQVRNDLTKEISKVEVKVENLKYESLRFTIWTGIGVVITLGSMIAHGFHWI